MRQLVPMFLLVATLATTAHAQDSAPTQPAPTKQSGSGDYGYGGRAEVFVNGFGVFGNGSSGNGITQQETQSGGAAAGYRFHLNAASSLEGRYGFSRDSQKYTIGGTGCAVSSVPSYLSEISGSYIYSLPEFRYFQAVDFQPRQLRRSLCNHSQFHLRRHFVRSSNAGERHVRLWRRRGCSRRVTSKCQN